MSTQVIPDQSLFNKFVHITFRYIRPFLMLIGFFTTILVLEVIYGDLGITILIKGISIQNTINIVLTFNFWEMIIWIYFILSYVLLFIVEIIITSFLKSDSKINYIHGLFNSFIEGLIILPLIIMVAFPFLIQTILPTIIYSILVIEICIPFALFGKLFQNFSTNLKVLLLKYKLYSNNITDFLTIIFKIVIVYPIPIYFMLILNLDLFFNFIYYHFLWENPQSTVALATWDFFGQIFSIIQLNDQFIQRYFLSFIIIAISSSIYLYFYNQLKIVFNLIIDNYVLPYKA